MAKAAKAEVLPLAQRTVALLGVRHHGPGSARSVLRALEEFAPDVILVEGPADAQDSLAYIQPATGPQATLLGEEVPAPEDAMVLPVAQMIYAADEPALASFYPYVEFCPEWQTFQFARERNIPVRLIDLPHTHFLALLKEHREKLAAEAAAALAEMAAEASTLPLEDETPESDDPDAAWAREQAEEDAKAQWLAIAGDPIAWMAREAGYDEPERWWEHAVEESVHSSEVFDALAEAMGLLRAAVAERAPQSVFEARIEALREAWMRRELRTARKEFARVAVVCGAWHVPALQDPMPGAGEDNALLKGLPKIKVTTTWVPWTYTRLTRASGYGAGIEAPGWYAHLWTHLNNADGPGLLVPTWLTRVARHLRGEGLDISPAHAIEATRLAEALAAMRGRTLAGLGELTEAIVATQLHGSPEALTLLTQRLYVGVGMGRVPSSVPTVPLQRDIDAQIKALRMKVSHDEKEMVLDLRKEGDLARSVFFHRMHLLDIPWAISREHAAAGRGTFKETWMVQWKPEFALSIVEASALGNTVEVASGTRVMEGAREATQLTEVCQRVDDALKAALDRIIPDLLARLDDMAALASDVGEMLESIPPLANVVRYGSVRGPNADSVGAILHGLVARASAGLPTACTGLDQQQSEAMCERISQADAAIRLVEDDEHSGLWRATLGRLADMETVHGVIGGRVTRMLMDQSLFSEEEGARRLSLALSRAAGAESGAAWISGFLAGSGLLLVYSDTIWNVLDEWLTARNEEEFRAVLPLLRRTFSDFDPADRVRMGQRVISTHAPVRRAAGAPAADDALDHELAAAVLPVLMTILAPLPAATQEAQP